MRDPGEALQSAARRVSGLFRTHGGSVDVTAVDDDGTVEVRFGGMCSGCPTKVMCLEHTVRPGLSVVPGVRAVVATGARVSEEAADRVQTFLGDVEARATGSGAAVPLTGTGTGIPRPLG